MPNTQYYFNTRNRFDHVPSKYPYGKTYLLFLIKHRIPHRKAITFTDPPETRRMSIWRTWKRFDFMPRLGTKIVRLVRARPRDSLMPITNSIPYHTRWNLSVKKTNRKTSRNQKTINYKNNAVSHLTFRR